jgi:hypothetical protein
MMIKKILAGYSSVLVAIIRFVALMAICVGAGFLVVWPLWRLASVDPVIYTIAFCVLALAVVVFFAGSRIKHAFTLNPRHFVVSLLRKLVIIAGIAIPVWLVMGWHRLAAGIVLLAAIAVYGYLAFVLDTGKRDAPEWTSTEK